MAQIFGLSTEEDALTASDRTEPNFGKVGLTFKTVSPKTIRKRHQKGSQNQGKTRAKAPGGSMALLLVVIVAVVVVVVVVVAGSR